MVQLKSEKEKEEWKEKVSFNSCMVQLKSGKNLHE